MAGANDVFLKQAGTGAAWMGPQSSFDPVLFAREAAYAKIGAEQGKKEEQQKAKEAFFSKLKINPEQVLATDAMTSQQEDLAALNDYLKEIMGADGWNMNTEQNAQYQTQLFAQKEKLRKAQESQYLKFKDLEKDKTLLGDEMENNGQVWYAPEMYSGEESFAPYQSEYDEIVKSVSQDPVYGRNQNSIIGHAKIIFRDKHPELLNPIQKPSSIPELWNKVKDIAVNQIKEVKGSDYNVKTDEYSSWDEDVEITDNNGNKRTIKSTKSNAIDIFNNDLDTQYSAKYYYDRATPEVKKQYEGSQNPVLDYYLDQVKGFSGDVTTSNVTKSDRGNSISIGGQRANEDVTFTPFDRKAQYNRNDGISATSNIRGWDIVDKNKKGITITGQHIRYYYDTKKKSHVKHDFESTGELENAVAFKAPVITGTTLSKLKQEMAGKYYNGERADQYFARKFGSRFQDIPDDAAIDEIILGDDEIQFFQAIQLGKHIKDRKFASGKLKWSQSGTDDEGDITRTINGAIVPLEDVDADFISKTGVSLLNALDDPNSGYPDIDYDLTPTTENKSKNSVPGFDKNKSKKY
jgi:hypothetical protein